MKRIKKTILLAILLCGVGFTGTGDVVDGGNKKVTDETSLWDIEMSRTTMGALKRYITGGMSSTQDLERVSTELKQYTDSKEFQREVIQYAEYYVVTNPVIDVKDTTITNTMDEALNGIAFDLYTTNSVYFVDGGVPTLKFFAPTRRRAYFGNRISCVEIGDEEQVFKTYNQQVDGILAVVDPSKIRFMSTLDRNAPLDEGRTLSLQDYFDAFNPILIPELLNLYRTNNFDFSIGNLSIGESASLKDSNSNEVARIQKDSLTYMDVFKITPSVYEDKSTLITNSLGQVSYAQETNSIVKIKGEVQVSGEVIGDSIVARKGFSIFGFDDVFARCWGWATTNGVKYIIKGDTNLDDTYEKVTLSDFIDFRVAPFVAATNEYNVGVQTILVNRMKKGRDVWYGVKDDNSVRPIIHTVFKNKRAYLYDAAVCDATSFNEASDSPYTITNVVVHLPPPSPLKYSGEGDLINAGQHLDVTITVDLSGCAHNVRIDVGTANFSNINVEEGEIKGEWETILSTIEPDIRTEYVEREETTVSYDYIWDETLNDWVEDTANPIYNTVRWVDTYDVDMCFSVEAFTCKQFKFTQVGDKMMKVEIIPLYKTTPQSAL